MLHNFTKRYMSSRKRLHTQYANSPPTRGVLNFQTLFARSTAGSKGARQEMPPRDGYSRAAYSHRTIR